MPKSLSKDWKHPFSAKRKRVLCLEKGSEKGSFLLMMKPQSVIIFMKKNHKKAAKNQYNILIYINK